MTYYSGCKDPSVVTLVHTGKELFHFKRTTESHVHLQMCVSQARIITKIIQLVPLGDCLMTPFQQNLRS